MDDSLLLAERFTWLSSWPKSGNTFLRMLYQAYYENGPININDVTTSLGDNSAFWFQNVSPKPVADLNWESQLLLRPAALFNQMTSMHSFKRFIKTHCVNATMSGMPHLIPSTLTQRAVYIIRDPRDVVISMQTYMSTEKGISIEEAADLMNNPGYGVKGEGAGPTPLTTWSKHVLSWVEETRYPVAVMKYEDLCEHTEREFTQFLQFCEIEPDPERVKTAIEACRIAKLAKQEQDKGFREDFRCKVLKPFFHKGGSRWRDELDPAIAARIEQDHGEVMEKFGYLEAESLRKVS